MNKPLTYRGKSAIIRLSKIDDDSPLERVYIIGTLHFFKIGVSAAPLERMADLQTANPLKLSLVFESERLPKAIARLAERDAHRLFGAQSCEGEWFAGLEAEQFISGVKNCVNRRLGVSKHPWSGTECICAVCGENRSPSQLDENLTCWVCQRHVEDGLHSGSLTEYDAVYDSDADD